MLTIDLAKYRANVRYITSLTCDKTPEERLSAIGLISLSLNVPIIVVACYIGELYGFSPQLNAFIQRLRDFYHIDEVINYQS